MEDGRKLHPNSNSRTLHPQVELIAASCEALPPPAMGGNWSNATNLCGAPPSGQLEDAWDRDGMYTWMFYAIYEGTCVGPPAFFFH